MKPNGKWICLCEINQFNAKSIVVNCRKERDRERNNFFSTGQQPQTHTFIFHSNQTCNWIPSLSRNAQLHGHTTWMQSGSGEEQREKGAKFSIYNALDDMWYLALKFRIKTILVLCVCLRVCVYAHSFGFTNEMARIYFYTTLNTYCERLAITNWMFQSHLIVGERKKNIKISHTQNH